MASNQLQDAQAREMFRTDQEKGAAVHTFDPDASPEEKAATVGKARDQLKDIRPKDKDLDTAKGSSTSVSESDWVSPPICHTRARCRYRRFRCHTYNHCPRR